MRFPQNGPGEMPVLNHSTSRVGRNEDVSVVRYGALWMPLIRTVAGGYEMPDVLPDIAAVNLGEAIARGPLFIMI
jgi:hypothetical protein